MTDARVSPVALTCGDPSGIGLEVALKAWEHLRGDIPFFLICDPAHLPSDAQIKVIDNPGETGAAMSAGLPVLTHAFPGPATPGQPTPGNAIGVVDVIRRAVRLVQKGEASAICTAPISKKELASHAGFIFPGHTEFLADLAGADHPVMMIASDELRVVPATVHIPLSKVPTSLTAAGLEKTICITEAALKDDFGIASPRIAVSGLNPHAGENGLLGAEELMLIAPVCERLRDRGMRISGPLSADTMFHPSARALYDAAVLMYHDQALIPAKTLAFDTGVNITLGLPFIRTSPDHGTAFDIAGHGKANPSSMIHALKRAAHMAATRRGAAKK